MGGGESGVIRAAAGWSSFARTKFRTKLSWLKTFFFVCGLSLEGRPQHSRAEQTYDRVCDATLDCGHGMQYSCGKTLCAGGQRSLNRTYGLCGQWAHSTADQNVQTACHRSLDS